MAALRWKRHELDLDISLHEVTGAVGDSVTVLPIVVAVAVLTDITLTGILVWFGVFQIVWGLYYGVPLSVEPMKALAGLVIAGAVTTGEFLVAGLLAGVVLIGIGATDSIGRIEHYLDEPVIRGIQFAVALILLETGLGLGIADPVSAGVGIAVAVVVIALGSWNLTALAVLLVGGGFAAWQTGLGAIGVASVTMPGLALGFGVEDLTLGTLEATGAQLAMTVGNAAVATSLLLQDFYDRDISPDELATSMGVMNMVSIPLGGVPMCHGSGGVAGKYTFGARTAMANLVLGIGYVALGIGAVGLLTAFPQAMLGVVLVLVALQLARAGFSGDRQLVVATVGVVGLLVNVGVALVAGILLSRVGKVEWPGLSR